MLYQTGSTKPGGGVSFPPGFFPCQIYLFRSNIVQMGKLPRFLGTGANLGALHPFEVTN